MHDMEVKEPDDPDLAQAHMRYEILELKQKLQAAEKAQALSQRNLNMTMRER